MNKKVLVLTLALVVAFASSAMAAVNFGGEFSAEIKQDITTWDNEEEPWNTPGAPESGSFKLLHGDFGFSNNLKLNLKSSSDTWDLTVNFKKASNLLAFDALDGDAGYTLKVNDDLFGLTVWQGAKNNQGYVNDPFSLIRGRRENSSATIRAKAPVMDVANVTLQLEPGSSVLGFVTADVAGADVGLAVQRKFSDKNLTFANIENALDTVVLHAAYDFEVAKVTVGGGLSMNNTNQPKGYEDLTDAQKEEVDTYTAKLEDALAYAIKVEAPVTDQIKAEASYVVKQDKWQGNGKNSTVATLKGTYEADDLTVKGSFTTEGKQKNEENKDNRTTTIALDGTYNITADIKASAGAEYKIEKDKLELEESINTTKINASVSAPIVADLATAEVKLGYTGDNFGAIQVGKYLNNPSQHTQSNSALKKKATSFALAKSLFEAEATITVTPVAKLEVKPAVIFKSFKDGNAKVGDIRELRDSDFADYDELGIFTAGSITTLKADATYKVGGGATITLSAGNHTYNFTEVQPTDSNNDTKFAMKYNNPFASVAVKVTF